MSNQKNHGWVAAAVFCFMGFAQIPEAYAVITIPDPPLACVAYPESLGWSSGYITGVNIVNQAWNGINQDCTKLVVETSFQDTIRAAFSLIKLNGSPSPYIQCRYLGYNQGLNDRIKEILEECVEPCAINGAIIGEWATIMYCELSLAGMLGMIEELIDNPLTPCDIAQSASCEAAFDSKTQVYPFSIPPWSCYYYTPYYDVAYEPIWELTQHNQCVANPLP